MSRCRCVSLSFVFLGVILALSLTTGTVAGTLSAGSAALAADSTSDSISPVESSIQQSNGGQSDEDQFDVSSVTIHETPVEPGDVVEVEAVIRNLGDEPAAIDVTLGVDGETVDSQTAEHVDPAFPIIAQFELSLDEPGTYTISTNGVEADRKLVVEGDDNDAEEDDADSNDGADTADAEDDNGDAEDDDPDLAPERFSIVAVTLEDEQVEPGETVIVRADIANDGDEPADYEVVLEVDDEPVGEPELVPEILPEPDVGAQHVFEYEPAAEGTYTISVNGVEADSTLEVATADDGGLFSFLGFLPLGLIRTVALFVGLPVLMIYLALKALAIYLGY